MPAVSNKQANAAKLAGAVKTGNVSPSEVNPSIKAMAKMSMSDLRHFMHKENYTLEEKKELLIGLKAYKQSLNKENSVAISPVDTNLLEDTLPTNVIANTFSIEGDFSSYVASNRGISRSSKENDALSNLKANKGITPTEETPFKIAISKTDPFGNNCEIVIKKHRKGNGFVYCAYEKDSSSDLEKTPKASAPKPQAQPSQKQPAPQPSKKVPPPPAQIKEQGNLKNKIKVTTTVPFKDDIEGADVLADLFTKLGL